MHLNAVDSSQLWRVLGCEGKVEIKKKAISLSVASSPYKQALMSRNKTDGEWKQN